VRYFRGNNPSEFQDWFNLTDTAARFDEAQNLEIQDNSKLPRILDAAEADIRQEQIRFEKGASGTTFSGKIKGDQIVDYQLLADKWRLESL
jgi:hypothetical protein